MEALRSIQEEFGTSFEELFETITTDNGTEFRGVLNSKRDVVYASTTRIHIVRVTKE